MYNIFIIGIFITLTSAFFFNNALLDEKKKNLRTHNLRTHNNEIIKKYIPPDLSKSVYFKNLRGKNSDKIIKWYSKNDTCIIIEEKDNTKKYQKYNINVVLFGLYRSFIVYFLNLFNTKNEKNKNNVNDINNVNNTNNVNNAKYTMQKKYKISV